MGLDLDWHKAPRLQGAARERAKARVKAGLLRRPPPRFVVGRYELGEKLGQGASGAVHRARDPQLQRDVAVKLFSATGRESRERCLAEGRALARLDHPNVVRIYDTGMHGDDVFIAMELIPGRTLRGWLVAEQRSPREILDVFIAAGRGLAAAHAAGVVHRDFKPDNVIVGPLGVRVVDFGLAQEGAEGATPDSAGTPAYAAPEQSRGEPGPASDQFAFSVTLAEALTGTRPGANGAVDGLGAGVGRRIRRALERGLRESPGERFASMDELVAALQPRRRHAIGATAAVLALTLVGVAGASAELGHPNTPTEQALPPVPAHVVAAESLLDRGQLDASERALADAEGPRAGVIRATLLAKRGEHEQAETIAATAAGAAAAMGDDATEFDAWITAVVAVDRQRRHDDALKIARTAEAVALRLGNPPELTARLHLATGMVHMGAGEYEDAERLLTRAAEVGAGHTRGRAQMTLGGVFLRQGRKQDGLDIRELARETLVDALGEKHPDVAMADVAIGQALKHLTRYDEARTAYAKGLAGLERVHGREHPALTIPLLNFGNLELFTGHLEAALALHERYVEIVRRTYPEGHSEHGRAEMTIGDALIGAGRPEEAIPHIREALRVAENRFGPHHFRTAWATTALAQAHSMSGDHRAATEGAAAGLALAEGNWNSTSPQLLSYLLAAGEIAVRANETSRGKAYFERAEAIAREHDRAEDLELAHQGLARATPGGGS